MRILQITDLHVGLEGEDTDGVDVRKNFVKILASIQSQQADHLVVSGDLCYRDGNRDIYHWLKEKLDSLTIPYDLISGNHDDPTMLAQTFAYNGRLKEGELYYTNRIEGEPVIFLDTTTGVVSEKQLQWLKAQLDAHQQELIIFMHHPPVFAGVRFMDSKHHLRNMDEVQAILTSHPFNLTIFTGHYHVEKTIRYKNLEVNITPSCFFQIDQQSLEFKVDHYRVGFRKIELDDKMLRHSVCYV